MTPKTTRAAVYERGGSISVQDVALPELKDGELLVRITACGICPGETVRWYVDGKAPFGLGHEPVGVIEARGAGAAPARPWEKPFAPGERVFVHHHAPCMTCRHCMRGDYVQCQTWRATKIIPGGMAQLAVVPAENVRADVLRVPDSIDDETATLIEPLATVSKSLRRSGMRRGDTVLVIGLGVMGMLHVALARKRGASQVFGADRVSSRLARAENIGADRAFDVDRTALGEQVLQATGGAGANIVIVGPGSKEALDAAASSVAPGGAIVMFAPLSPGETWPLPVHDFYFKDISVIGSYSAGPNDTRESLKLLSTGFDVKPIFTHRFTLDAVAEAYALVAHAQEALKVVVYPQTS